MVLWIHLSRGAILLDLYDRVDSRHCELLTVGIDVSRGEVILNATLPRRSTLSIDLHRLGRSLGR